jgi:hypothetical protein
MAQFKFISPGSLYSARSVQARTRTGNSYSLSPNQSVCIPDEELTDLQLKLDYHKQVLAFFGISFISKSISIELH